MDEYTYIVNVEGVVVREEKYLLIERAATEDHAAGVLAFPGGKIEQSPGGDDPIERTARRELAEEVGIDIGTIEYVRSRTFETDAGDECINIITLCRYGGGDAYPRDQTEVAAVHWLSSDEIFDHEAVPEFLKQDIRRIEDVR